MTSASSPGGLARAAATAALMALALLAPRSQAADAPGTATADAGTASAAPAGGTATAAAVTPDGGATAAAGSATLDGGSVVTAAPPIVADTCHAGISPETTQHIFNAISKAAPTGSQCTFEGVSTNKLTLNVKWSLSGKAQEPMLVEIRDCMKSPPAGRGAFVITMPPDLLQHCPEWKSFEAQFRSAVDGEAPLTFSTGGAAAPKWRRYAIIALLLAAGAGVIALRRRTPEPPKSGGSA